MYWVSQAVHWAWKIRQIGRACPVVHPYYFCPVSVWWPLETLDGAGLVTQLRFAKRHRDPYPPPPPQLALGQNIDGFCQFRPHAWTVPFRSNWQSVGCFWQARPSNYMTRVNKRQQPTTPTMLVVLGRTHTRRDPRDTSLELCDGRLYVIFAMLATSDFHARAMSQNNAACDGIWPSKIRTAFRRCLQETIARASRKWINIS